ncbi:hypothetical protein SGCOL_000999 [Colletotrichum sp. CLE4]
MSQTATSEREAGPVTKAIRVAIIGAGASGLVTAKYLRQARQYFGVPDVEVRVFEKEDGVGGVCKYKAYEEAEMVSSKYLTAFSDFRVSKDLPDFLPTEEYVRYLKGFCTHFDLWGVIETKTEILRVSHTSSGHRVFFRRIERLRAADRRDGEQQEESWDCDAIAICSGLNNVPFIPSIEGLENMSYLHSSEVKERRQFGSNTSIMILGAGETAMDIAHLAITSEAQEVVMCHKGGFFCAKKVVPLPVVLQVWKPDPRQKPVDTAIASFLDTAYLPERLQHSSLLWTVYDKTFKCLHYISGGTAAGPDQWVGEIKGDRNNVDSYSKECEHAEALSQVVKPNLIIAATGYVRRFDFLEDDYPKPNELDVRGIWRRGEVTAGFIGFVRPGIGAIPPLAELQAQLWVLELLRHKYPQEMALSTADSDKGESNNAVPHYEVDYALKARGGHDLFKSKHGVEQESYAYQLALDMGSAPTFSFMRRQGFKALYTWAMGSNFNTKFRLIGPWRWTKGALPIMRGELFDVVKQTGGGVFFTTYTLLPLLLFGYLTLLLQATAGMLRLAGMKERANRVLGSGNIPRREGDDLQE